VDHACLFGRGPLVAPGADGGRDGPVTLTPGDVSEAGTEEGPGTGRQRCRALRERADPHYVRLHENDSH
jgi:hypothetical protein